MDGTDIKAGWIKGASMYHYIDPVQEACLRAGARASMITGAPMHTHTEVGTYALEQIAIVESEGMDLTRFGCAHMDRNPDYWLHKKNPGTRAAISSTTAPENPNTIRTPSA